MGRPRKIPFLEILLKEAGMSYSDFANEMGWSRQRVHWLCKKPAATLKQKYHARTKSIVGEKIFRKVFESYFLTK